MGMWRSWTSTFNAMRSHQRARRQSTRQRLTSSPRINSILMRRHLAVQDELQRLLKGFQSKAGTRVKSTVVELATPLGVPDWQKSRCWEESSAISNCTDCLCEFGIFKKKHHCRLVYLLIKLF